MAETSEGSKELLVDGRCDARFTAVRDAFARNFIDQGELGAAVCVLVDGIPVVDLYGGWAAVEQVWRRDTLVNVYSVGKGIVTILLLILVEKGLLDLDRPVSAVWPEFAAAGKSEVALRTLLAHRAGLPAVRKALPDGTERDWHRMCAELAAEAPFWEPGSKHGYHVNSFGFLVGELVRRVTGLSVGAALRQLLTGPLDADLFIGLPPEHYGRVATMGDPGFVPADEKLQAAIFPSTGDVERDETVRLAYFNPRTLSGAGFVNTPAWRSAEIPSANAHGTARAVASIYDALLRDGPGGRRFVGKGLRGEATRVHSDGDDYLLARPSRFGLGFQLTQPSRPLGPNAGSFGHFGHGGALGFADPDAGVAFAYLMNRPGEGWRSTRTQRLIDALYESL